MVQKFYNISRKEPTLAILVTVGIFVVLLLTVSLGNKFFSFNNIQSMAYQIPEFAFLALAMSITMLTGGIDLSVITNANLAAILAGFILTGRVFGPEAGLSEGVIVAIALGVALISATTGGVINGLLIAKMSVPPILATLGTMIFFDGVSMAITGGRGVVGFPELFLRLGTDAPGGVPVIFILILIVLAIVLFWIERTPFGKSIYLLGENRIASLFSGVKNEQVTVKVYALSGFLVGFAAIIIASRVNSAKVGYGDTYLLQAILVAVLGGISPMGGRGKLMNVMIGVLILQMLQSAFTIFAFSPYAKRLIFGFMLLLVMVVNYYLDKIHTRSKFVQEELDTKAEVKNELRTSI
jgi:simple sugar transport system permease protein